ncbi:hypothetical protein LIER_26610 [Lithospermum erythrorhizon]|uniref:Membrane-associated kinase regulator 5 n=1 Tax=Lithospermum erythrorhizon TaxID=34254 RepID=A0AAV3RAI0_LITER
MEAFNLLKFWRTTAADNISAASDVISDIDYVNSDYQKTPTTTTTITTDVRNRAPDIELETEDDEDSFFELELSSLDGRDNKYLNASKKTHGSPKSPISILRSAPKFKVLMLRFNKPKSELNLDLSKKSKSELNCDFANLNKKESRKSFETESKIDDVAPIISRDNSLRTKLMREIIDESNNFPPNSKKPEKNSKNYLKLIRPLYTVASKRYNGGKIRFSTVSPMSSPAANLCSPRRSSEEKGGNNRGSGLKVVYKHLGKSRSASSAAVGVFPSSVNRRDDSLLLHNDGIQSAILHCKRSYNSSSKELSRYSTDSSPEKFTIEEQKRCSI